MSITEEELNQRTTQLDQREAVFKADRLRFELGNALHGLKVRPEALADATTLLAQACTAEFGADGRVSTLRIGEEAYESVADAATAFLAHRAYLADAKGGKEPSSAPAPLVKPGEGFLSSPSTHKPFADAIKLPKGSVTDLLERGYNASDLVTEGWATPPK